MNGPGKLLLAATTVRLNRLPHSLPCSLWSQLKQLDYPLIKT